MKTCTSCQVSKEESSFYFQDKSARRLHAECKACYTLHRKSYMATHYLKYGDIYRERARVRRARIKKELQAKMMQYLGDKSCESCGEADARVLEFDHINPSEKSFNIARGITHGLAWEAILDEIKKCRILCANCHRKHTAEQQGWYRLPNTTQT